MSDQVVVYIFLGLFLATMLGGVLIGIRHEFAVRAARRVEQEGFRRREHAHELKQQQMLREQAEDWHGKDTGRR